MHARNKMAFKRRKKSKDSYNYLVYFVIIVEIAVGIYLLSRLMENQKWYAFMKNIPESENPDSNTLACVPGEADINQVFEADYRSFAKNRTSENLQIMKILENTGISNPIFVNLKWTHSTGGKNSRTITDKVVNIFNPFVLKNPQAIYLVNGASILFSPKSKKINCRSHPLGALSRSSSSVSIEYFNPTSVYVTGKVTDGAATGTRIITLDQHLIVSDISAKSIANNTLFSSVFIAATIVFLTFTLFIRMTGRSMQSVFNQDPNGFFIFDATGGNEYIAIAFYIIYPIAAFAVGLLADQRHFFLNDALFAALAAGFFLIVHLTRNVEFFYVASRKEAAVFEISRGFSGLNRKKMCAIDEWKPYVKTHTGSKGQKSYTINCSIAGKDRAISDTYGNPNDTDNIIGDFENFRQGI